MTLMFVVELCRFNSKQLRALYYQLVGASIWCKYMVSWVVSKGIQRYNFRLVHKYNYIIFILTCIISLYVDSVYTW